MLASRLHQDLQQSKLLPPKAKLVVAVSGGVDSVSLLDLLAELKNAYGWQLAVAHYDHNVRPDSYQDAELVADLANKYELPFYLEKNQRDWKSEAKLRAARYDFLEGVRDNLGYDYIVTAHHNDDRLETAIFNAIRGADRGGLTAMRARRGSIVRPLLPYSKAELITYANLKNLRFREDSTNADLGFSRNFIRRELLPLGPTIYRDFKYTLTTQLHELQRLDESINSQLAAVAKHLAHSRDERSIQLKTAGLRKLGPKIVFQLVSHLAKQLSPGVGLSSANLKEATDFVFSSTPGNSMHLKDGLHLVMSYDTVAITCQNPAKTNKTLRAKEHSHVLTSKSPYTGVRHKLWLSEKNVDSIDGVQLKAKRAYVRNWQPGDIIRPLGLGGTKKLQDIFVDKKIPRAERADWPVVVNDKNEIMWLPQLAVSEDYLASEQDSDPLNIVCEEI